MNTFEIRRNRTLAGALGAVAALVAIAYLQRAATGGGIIDWATCALMALIAVVQLAGLVDSRTPLAVADQQGVRFRLGHEWLGLPWASIEQVVVEQRDGPVRDGRLVVVPRDLDGALDALLPSSRRAVDWQRRLHGAPLTIPLSIGTRCTSSTPAADLRLLADGRTDVVAARTQVRFDVQAVTGRARTTVGRLLAGEPVAHLDGADAKPDGADAQLDGAAAHVNEVSAIREARPVVRTEIVRESAPRPEAGPEAGPEASLGPAPERVRPEPVANMGAVVFDDVSPRGAARPVIGPQLRAARLRTGLDVDGLSERTRIRPHVIEGIEVDDFSACGGDFYARGHLTTLARYLGLDADEMLDAYDEHYAHAPISASRVFEAELATGMSGGMRATTGGTRWGLVAAAVMALLMVWGVARYFTEPANDIAAPVVSDSAGLAANHKPITSPLTHTRALAVRALGGPSHVVVRDRTGKVLWSGEMHRGQIQQVAGIAPFTVRASHGSVVRVRLGKHWVGPVGPDATRARRTVG